MAKFFYRMQNILNLKYKLEDQAKMEFAVARRRLTEEEEKLEALFCRKGEYEEEGRRLREDTFAVLDILENRNAILQMDEFIELQKLEVAKAEEALEAERQKLQEVMQERKIHEKLREKAFEAFMKEENARESKEIDELVSYTYGQKQRRSSG